MYFHNYRSWQSQFICITLAFGKKKTSSAVQVRFFDLLSSGKKLPLVLGFAVDPAVRYRLR